MKIYGFFKDSNEPNLVEQVTLEVDASELRDLAGFFLKSAEEMDSDTEWDHEHLCDYLGHVIEQDLVLYNKNKGQK